MKLKLKIILAISILSILAFSVILSFRDLNPQDSQVESPQQFLPQNYQALLPKKSDNPLESGEEVSFEKAHKKISFPIPLPKAEKVKRVWIRINPENPAQQSIAIRFKSDLILIVHTSNRETPPDWDRVIAAMPVFKKVEINGIFGIGDDPGITDVRGQPYHYPGSVGWLVNGLDITLYSDTLSLEELLAVARTMQIENPLPVIIKTATEPAATELPIEVIVPQEATSEIDLSDEMLIEPPFVEVTPTPAR